MLQPSSDNHSLSTSLWIKIVLCTWMGAVLLLFVILFWPPSFWGLAQGLGISDLVQKLQAWIMLFFTAGYLS